MRKGVWLVLLFITVSPVAFSAGEDDSVAIYADANPKDFGKSWKRQGIKNVLFKSFHSARTLSVDDPDGILTAVLVNAKVEESLRKFLEGFQERYLDPAWFWKEDRGKKTIYTYFDPKLRLQFSFSLEKPDERILNLVERTYQRDIKTRKEVTSIYQKNYVVRIHAAENVFEPSLDTITFDEALLMATLIGDTFQPLWGIRDGFGLLKHLPDRVEAERYFSLVNYRPIEKNKNEYLSFLIKVHRVLGSFPKNLWQEVKKEIETADSEKFQTPEELVVRKKGKEEEKVLLFYDALTRRGFETVLLAVRRNVGDDPFLMVAYRSGGRGNYGVLWAQGWAEEVTADWRRIPELVIGGEPLFVAMDVQPIFQKKLIEYPDSFKWKAF